MHRVLILNGPNLNMLGTREPEIYGTQSLDEIMDEARKKGKARDLEVEDKQSNHEGKLVDWIQQARGSYDGLIINAAAFTHTSIAIHDALKMLDIPIIEVHLSNPKEREEFRHFSYVEDLAESVIAGQGAQGYIMALEKLADLFDDGA